MRSSGLLRRRSSLLRSPSPSGPAHPRQVGRPLQRVVVQHEPVLAYRLPGARVEDEVRPALARRGLRRRLGGAGRARDPDAVLLVERPAPPAQLVGREQLRLVPGHGVEAVEERLQGEAAEVPGVQRRRRVEVARRRRPLRVGPARSVGPRRGERAVHGLRGVERQAQRGQVGAQGQRGQVRVGHADDGEQAQEAVTVCRRRRGATASSSASSSAAAAGGGSR